MTADELRQRLIRNFDEAALEPFSRPPLYESRSARLSEGTVAAKLGASVDVMPPGKRSCPYHLHHAQEEMFIVLEGEGTLRVAGQEVPIRTGDVIHVPPGPEYPHQIVNTSDRPLKYLSISTQEEPEICEYPDSGKYSAWAPGFQGRQRRDASLDYWEGEP
jgi:uncharacterized cupin superfamily protein